MRGMQLFKHKQVKQPLRNYYVLVDDVSNNPSVNFITKNHKRKKSKAVLKYSLILMHI